MTLSQAAHTCLLILSGLQATHDTSQLTKQGHTVIQPTPLPRAPIVSSSDRAFTASAVQRVTVRRQLFLHV